MGLQVWIPMNGNLNNYGLGLPFIRNHEAQIYDHGKIGKCYKYANSYTVISSCLPENPTEFSICAWVCLLPNFNKNNGCHLVSIGNNLRICIAKDTRFVQIITHNASRYSGSNALSSSIEENIWYHIAVTYKSGEIAIYINGEKDTIHTISQLTGIAENIYFSIGSYGNEYSNALINDYRIYNDCLSPRQIKEISKGLICHYPLGEIDGKIGGRNLIINNNTVNGWVDNHGSVVGSTAYKATDYIPVDPGDTITFQLWTPSSVQSWIDDTYFDSDKNYVTGYNGVYITSNHIIKTYTVPEGAAYVRISYSWATGYKVKLEKGNKATYWTPAPEDDTSFYDNVIYDTSGYCNNGSVTDSTCPTWSNDTPRYKGSYVFNGNNQYLNCGTSTMIEGQEEITINCWAYMDDWTKFNARLFSCTEGAGYNTEYNGNGNWLKFCVNVFSKADKTIPTHSKNIGGYPGIKLSDMASGWHMITCVYKASVGDAIYLDGKLYEKKTYTSYGIHFNKNSYLFLGGESSGVNCIAPYFNGKLSDFRIYATALDNQTIEELYKVGASVDNNGNLMLAGEVIEE